MWCALCRALNDQGKRLLNQGLFERLLLSVDGDHRAVVSDYKLTPPARELASLVPKSNGSTTGGTVTVPMLLGCAHDDEVSNTDSMVPPAGIEPATKCLEGTCSIR